MQKIKTGDMVYVTTGKFKGKTAKILRIGEKWVYLQGLNIRKAAKKGQWYVDVHHAINISNVQFWDGDAFGRVGITKEDNKKVRVLKKTGKVIEN